MLIEKDFPKPTPITFAARDLIAELKAGPMVVMWFDLKRGPMTMPISDARRVRPDTRSIRCRGNTRSPC